MPTNAAGATYKDVRTVCPLCQQELTLVIFEQDFEPPRRFRVSVARIPQHPVALITVCNDRLGILCPTSNQEVFQRCDGEHVFEDARPSDQQCLDPTCWKGSQQ